MRLAIQENLQNAFPGLQAQLLLVKGVKVRRRSDDLDTHKRKSFDLLRGEFDLATLKDEGRIRAYRDFFWRVGIDPTKIRPASEALLRRILQGKEIPTINTLVDAYNVASMETRVALAAFDHSTLRGDLTMRFARDGEEFLGIGMKTPIALRGKEIVVEDEASLVAVYPYRDADSTKVSSETQDVVIMVCGVPGIDDSALQEAAERVAELITRFCGGESSPP